MIGLLMLVGIVVTNAIVLLDLINQHRSAGMGIKESIIEGGRRRLRPDPDDGGGDHLRVAADVVGPDRVQRLHLAAAGGGRDRWSDHVDAAHAGAGAVLYSLVEGAKGRLRRGDNPVTPAQRPADPELAPVGLSPAKP